MYDGPEAQTILKPFRSEDVTDKVWTELVLGTTPECGQATWGVRVHGWFFEDAFAWVEELTDERIVESWLPFLDDGHFKTAIVGTICIDGNGCPNVKVVMFTPISQGKFCLDKSVLGELKIFSRATVFTVQGMVHCRSNVEFGLHVGDVSETDVDTLWLEKWSREEVVGMEAGTP